ncbi:MAG: hypothetical protein IKK26_03540 [Clostridia bacterium]|nr:hypothetical protein [Clostridia bacterium]
MKKFYSVLSGLLVLALIIFEIPELRRFSSMIADGNSGYVGELVAKIFFVIAIAASSVLLIWGKKSRIAAICLTAAGGVAVYKTFIYVVNIIGNEMVFGIVLGNIIDMLEIVFFIAPATVILLLSKKASEKNVFGSLIATLSAFVLGIAGRIITFVSWGKSFASDFPLFFSAYGTDILRTLVMFAAFALLLLSFVPEKRKKRK